MYSFDFQTLSLLGIILHTGSFGMLQEALERMRESTFQKPVSLTFLKQITPQPL